MQITGKVEAVSVVSMFPHSDEFCHKYRFVRQIGKGTYSKVYEVSDATGSPFAAKFVPLVDEGYNPEEAQNLRQARHVNVVPVHEVLFTQTHCAIVMDLIRGGELFQKVALRPLPEECAKKHLKELLCVLKFLHANGVVHRDIKLENIMLTEEGTVQLIDFGFSKVVGDTKTLNSCCGSPNYMSPEMLKASRFHEELPSKHSRYGKEVDIWAAGVVLYVMLTGKYPFFDERRSIWHKAILLGQYTAPTTLSPEGNHLLASLLTVNCDERPSAADALRHPWFLCSVVAEQESDLVCAGKWPDKCKSPRPSNVSGMMILDSTNKRKTTPPLSAASMMVAAAQFTPPHNTHALKFESPQ